MSFTGQIFFIFFAVVFAVYWISRNPRMQNTVLLLASYTFYGWVAPWHTLVLAGSTILDYFLAIGMERDRGRTRRYLGLSLIANLGLLALVKYFHLFAAFFPADTGGFFLKNILLPAGLSFYLLKKMGYMLDVSRGVLKPTRDFTTFALYVSFFPQVISGPIDRPQKLIPQIEASRTWKIENFTSAWPLLVMGLFKKVVIADSIKAIVDQVFTMQAPTKLLLLTGGIAFTLQILADFSAYTDLSRGFSFLLGFETTENFTRPYLALSPAEFWNRWHITLSTWLRDYIFFPLRRMLLKQHAWPGWISEAIPPVATMLVSGIWHGVGWTFIIWGLYYGILLAAYQVFLPRVDLKKAGYPGRVTAWLATFILIIIGWIIFRAPSLEWIWQTVALAPFGGGREQVIVALMCLSLTLFYSIPLAAKLLIDQWAGSDSWLNASYYALACLAIIVYINSASPDFIYFAF
jgi:D-alanyl-lipoteichoic acid acyltransferase DltB (MBOAT superfamily)